MNYNMGLERRYKRKKQQDVKKMYEREMKKMATMTDEQKIKHLTHLASKVYPDLENEKIDE
jgi:hypothetical protein